MMKSHYILASCVRHSHDVALGVNGGGNMYRRGGAKMMEWTPPPDGICMCQGGVVVRPPEGENGGAIIPH